MSTSRFLSLGVVHGFRNVSLLMLTLAFASVAAAGSAPNQGTGEKFRQIEQALRVADGHPNEQHRLYALRAYARGDQRLAAKQFRRAARFADKFSQHRLSLMHWNGEGVARDQALAYVWADLAAERGTPDLLANREKMWSELGAAERARVDQIGPGYYAEFGDAVAKPRQIAEMRRFANRRTGSHAGWTGSRLEVSKPQSNKLKDIDVSAPLSDEALYGYERAHPETYWRVQDGILAGGTTTVGDPQTEAAEGGRKAGNKSHRKTPERPL